ncbi:unnamed protein product (macronuclear) [Paramecium tetraurelia]|uniref:Transmembrane protein n=1 Tax=Paramecium tetraurelia TaxID=5888 RepID=A0CJ69_PARTE|nr:uncharacterized protein GSPATT00038618001 [Paramecium tetraurelia]CAK70836.1 unnamed protein product [Paramecium tetraurelia]|eukprot:XP_001438233.1 hypothetical protein (macronuclear) [Paramecium tetraurelia strain d4-2]
MNIQVIELIQFLNQRLNEDQNLQILLQTKVKSVLSKIQKQRNNFTFRLFWQQLQVVNLDSIIKSRRFAINKLRKHSNRSKMMKKKTHFDTIYKIQLIYKYILKSYVYQVLINNSHQFNSIKVYIQTNINDCRMIIKLIIVFNINQKLEGLQDHFELKGPKRKKSFKFSKLNNIKPFQQKNSQNSFRMIDNLNQTVLIKPPEINQDSSLIQLFIFFERMILTIDYIQI